MKKNNFPFGFMKRCVFFVLPLLIGAAAHPQWKYPFTKTVDSVDTYFGKVYKDPYRWLENLKDKEVEAWFKAQAELTDNLLVKIPGRDTLANEWLALDKLTPARFSGIRHKNGRVFYKKTLGGENVGKLFCREGWTGPEKLLFDPSTYKTGVTSTIQSIVPSFDGKFVALAISAAGAEVSEIRVLDVDHGNLLPDAINASYGPIGWALDNMSFFYDSGKTGDPQGVEFHLNRKTRLHRLGNAADADIDFFSNQSNPELGLLPEESPYAFIDENLPGYVLGIASTAQRELRMFYAPVAEMKQPKIKWNVLCKPSDNLIDYVFKGDYVYAVTHVGAPHYKVIRTSVKNPEWKNAETVIPEGPDTIQSLWTSKDFLFIVYSNGIVGRIVKCDFRNGQTVEVKLPMSGSVDISCPDHHANRCLVSISSWILPTLMYEFDAEKETFAKSIFNADVTYPGFENLITEEVEVPGHDGTMIPLSIIHKKDIPLDGSNSCILQGYGAYGSSYSPYFNVRHSIVLRGVVYAYAHVRGGGEKGEAWHKAGFKTTKPNTWKDFIACAEYLVKKGYTSPGKLGGTGTSAGGILISRAITERPDLFAAAVCNVGDANAMRCEFGTDGPSNAREYGTVNDPAECQALYEMDGVQHVRQGVKYPAVLGVGGWNDPRVAPWQPGKFIAALQNATTSASPVLMKVNYDSGHFTEEKIVTFKNFAGQFAFLLWQTGHKDFQPVK